MKCRRLRDLENGDLFYYPAGADMLIYERLSYWNEERVKVRVVFHKLHDGSRWHLLNYSGFELRPAGAFVHKVSAVIHITKMEPNSDYAEGRRVSTSVRSRLHLI